MSPTGRLPAALGLALLAGLGLAGCRRTCEKTWSRLARCAGMKEPDREAEQAFRAQCRKLAKPALRRCLKHEACDAFQTCVGRVRAGTEGEVDRCRRVWARALACEAERRRDPDRPLEPEKRRDFDAYCPSVAAGDLDECLRQPDCTAFRRCTRRALRGMVKPEIARPRPSDPDDDRRLAPGPEPWADLRILPGGGLVLSGLPLPLEGLDHAIRAAQREKPGLRIQIHADERADYALVIKVLDVLTARGVTFGLAPAPATRHP